MHSLIMDVMPCHQCSYEGACHQGALGHHHLRNPHFSINIQCKLTWTIHPSCQFHNDDLHMLATSTSMLYSDQE